MTARWAVDVVQPKRDLEITWEPISLLYKNEPPEDSPYHAASAFTHKLLRVLESVRAEAGDGPEASDAMRRLYWQYGAVLHHDRAAGTVDAAAVMGGDATPFLEVAGMDPAHNDAFGDEKWDAVIRERMDRGLDLVGTDVGTPIIAFDTPSGPSVPW